MASKKILIIVDSSSTIDNELAKKNDIEILPLAIYRNDNVKFLSDSLTISNDEFLKMGESGYKFSTGCTPQGIIEEVINEKLKKYDAIIALPITSKWSSQYSHLKALSKEKEYCDKLFVANTFLFGYETESLAIELRKKINEDIYTINELIDFAENYNKYVISYFFCQSLDGLVNSGRVPKIIGKLMKFTKIFPLIKVEGENHLETIIKNISETTNRIIKSIYKAYGYKLTNKEINNIAILTACNSEQYIYQIKNDLAKAFDISKDKIVVRNSPNIFINIVSRNAIGVCVIANKMKS